MKKPYRKLAAGNLSAYYGIKNFMEIGYKKEDKNNMGMTNKQFQGFIRLALGWLEKALEETPENKSILELKDIFQSMLEDD